MTDRPTVLYACYNSGRSDAAKVLTEHYAGDRVKVRSAGSEPGARVNPVDAQVLAERGLSTDAEMPKKLDDAAVQATDVVVTVAERGREAGAGRLRQGVGGRRRFPNLPPRPGRRSGCVLPAGSCGHHSDGCRRLTVPRAHWLMRYRIVKVLPPSFDA